MGKLGIGITKKAFKDDDNDDIFTAKSAMDDLTQKTEEQLEAMTKRMGQREAEYTKKLEDLISQTNRVASETESMRGLMRSAGEE